MIFEHRYQGHSRVSNGPGQTGISFAPDLSRNPVHFNGVLREGVAFREAISALHDVVVSDLRFKPKDRVAYRAWVQEQEQRDLLEVLAQSQQVQAQAQALRGQLAEVTQRVHSKMGPFYRAQQRYFDYLYKHDNDAWWVLDPVITVHPDRLFFECFSVDESTYGCLAANYEEFASVDDGFACGTTNVDYSAALYDEFQKIRTYKTTSFAVEAGGFEVQTSGEAAHREVKIDVPDSWVRGFLQVSSAMTLPATSFDLHPLDVYNLCRFLRRHREKRGPRSLRFVLEPGQPVEIRIEPFDKVIRCPRSVFLGDEPAEIRVWGRRRLHILERLIPIARGFRVHLLGHGLPSFWVADLGSMSYTLGLSGWTANDWSRSGNFDLMTPRAAVDSLTRDRVFAALKETWFATPEALSSRLNLDRATVLGALGIWTQAGRAIYDLDKGVYRCRELSQDPLPLELLRFANPREAAATNFEPLVRTPHRPPAGPTDSQNRSTTPSRAPASPS